MSNYTENKKKIDSMRNEYCTAGDVLFRTAIQMLLEHGQENFKDEEWYAAAVKSINDRHDEVEKEGKILIIGRSFELAILECAKKLAAIETYDLLIYIQREVFWSSEGIDYQRAIELLKNCMFALCDGYQTSIGRDILLDDVGFEEYELEELGYGYLLDTIEEDCE